MTSKSTSFSQAIKPHGFVGRIFGVLMEIINRPAYHRALDLLEVNSRSSILEIGFGTGKLIEMILKKEPSIYVAGIDPSETMLRVASNRFKNIHNIEFKIGTAESLSWKENTFSDVCALHSFQFWNNPNLAISEIFRVLKPGGKLILILRSHSTKIAQDLPNPISRNGNEIEDTINLLHKTGFVRAHAIVDMKSNVSIVAIKPNRF